MKTIKLTKNQIALVDDEDYIYLSKHSWIAANCPTNLNFYAQRQTNKKTVKMHRLIMNCPADKQIDHINGNTLDNRKLNLRIVAHQDNAKNRRHQKGAMFPYKGIMLLARVKTKPYGARITVNGKTLFLGTFATIKEAAKSYNIAALEHFGEFAKLNDIKP